MSFYWLSLFSGVLSPIRLLFFPFSLPLSLFGSSFITTISLAVVSSYQIVLLAFSLHFLFPPSCSSSMTTSPFVIAARFSPWPSASHFLRVSHRLIFYANALVSITPWLSLLSLPLLPSLFSLPIFFFCLISWVIFYRTPLVVITSYLSLLVPFFSVPTLYS